MRRHLKDQLITLKEALEIQRYKGILDLASEKNGSAWIILNDAEKYSAHFNSGTIKKLYLIC